MFKVGDELVCIDDTIAPHLKEAVARDYYNWVKKDKEYTVRQIMYNDGIVAGILLEEVINFPIFIALIGREQEPAFATWRFRKKAEATQYAESSKEEVVVMQ